MCRFCSSKRLRDGGLKICHCSVSSNVPVGLLRLTSVLLGKAFSARTVAVFLLDVSSRAVPSRRILLASEDTLTRTALVQDSVFCKAGKKCQGLKPDLGNPTVRRFR